MEWWVHGEDIRATTGLGPQPQHWPIFLTIDMGVRMLPWTLGEAGIDLQGASVQIDVEGAGEGSWHWGLGAGEAPPPDKKPDAFIQGRAPQFALVAAHRIPVDDALDSGNVVLGGDAGHRRDRRPAHPRLPLIQRLASPFGFPFVEHPSSVLRVRAREPESDAALMQRFARREAPAAELLYGRFSSRIYGLGIVMLGSDAAAQDLVQDTFVKLWRSADRYDASRGKLETWVLLVARSLAIDALRRRVLEARSLETLGRPPEADQRPQPDELAATADMAARARSAMEQLSGEQRAALELAYFGGKTSAEVAEMEGIPIGTAKTRIRTALLRLREAMAEEQRDV